MKLLIKKANGKVVGANQYEKNKKYITIFDLLRKKGESNE